MVTYSKVPSQHFLNVQSQGPGLLFQFLAAEFLKTFYCALEIESAILEYEEDPNRKRSAKKVKRDRQRVIDCVVQLAGPVTDWVPTLPWNTDQGNLSTMAYYAELYARKAGKKNACATNLASYVGKSLRYALQAREVLFSSLDPSVVDSEARGEPVDPLERRMLSQLVRSVKRMSLSINQNFIAYFRDENVVFFFLRHWKDFDELYGEGHVLDFLENTYRRGIDEAEQFLIKTYGNRGFENLFPTITAIFAAIRHTSSLKDRSTTHASKVANSLQTC